MADLKSFVWRALSNARDNGYDMKDEDPHDMALELGAYDSDLEGREPSELVEHIESWQKLEREVR